jgi:hypothetical protein
MESRYQGVAHSSKSSYLGGRGPWFKASPGRVSETTISTKKPVVTVQACGPAKGPKGLWEGQKRPAQAKTEEPI